jgi:hypothetical protein
LVDPSTSIVAPGNNCLVSASITEPDTVIDCAREVKLQHNDTMKINILCMLNSCYD